MDHKHISFVLSTYLLNQHCPGLGYSGWWIHDLITELDDRVHTSSGRSTSLIVWAQNSDMLHIVYLAGLCQRRQWPEPHYEVTPTRHGYTCVVRVNNREYQTSKTYPSEVLAKDAAATIAFTICRSFSVNDGMYPNGFAHDNIVQGRAVPVGAGRTARRQAAPATPNYRMRTESISSGSRSGGSSPDISDDSTTTAYSRHTPRQPNLYPSGRHVPSRQHR